MAFPNNPVDGQLYNEAGITYLFVSPPGVWTRSGGTPITIEESDPIFLNSEAVTYTEAPIDGTPYSRQNGGWVNAMSGSSITDLSDVDTTGVIGGDVLKYNGSTWTPTVDDDTDALVDLTDTTITAPANGEVLTYDGAAWVNAAPTGGGGAAIAYVREDGFKEEPLGNATTSLVLDVPANTFDGMLMVALVMWRTGTSNALTPPAGWTLHTDAFDDKNLGGQNQRIAIYYRTASSEPASYTWTGSESQRMSGSITSVVGSTAIQSVTEITTPDNDSVNKGKSLSGTAADGKISIIGATWVFAQSSSGDDCNITGDNIEYLSEFGSDTSARRLHTAVSYGGGTYESFHAGEDSGAIAGSHGAVAIELDGDPIRANEYNAPIQRDQGWRGPGQITVPNQDAIIGGQDFYFEIKFWVDGSATNENVFTIGGDGVTTGAIKGRILCYKTSSRGVTIIHSTGGDTTSGSTIMNNALAGQIDDRFVNVIIQRENDVVTTWLNGKRQTSLTPTAFSGFEPVNAGLHFFSYADGTTIGAANEGQIQEYRLEIAGNDNPDFVLPYDSTETTITSGLALGFDTPGLTNESTGTNGFATGTGLSPSAASSVAVGVQAETGTNSVCIGFDAGNTTASSSVAIGYKAKDANTGNFGVAIGRETLETGTGSNNIAIGYQAGSSTPGNNSVSIGYQAGFSSQASSSISIGYQANYSGSGTRSIVVNAQGSSYVNSAADEITLINGQQTVTFDNTTGLSYTLKKLSAPVTMRMDPSSGVYIFPNLPTSDPVVAGQLWNDAGTLKVSAG
jgi:hypothetical protein